MIKQPKPIVIAMCMIACQLLAYNLIAQTKRIFLRPATALHYNFTAEDKKLSESHAQFHAGKQRDLLMDLRFGILLDYQYHDKWAISTGLVGAGVGVGSRIAPMSSYGISGYTQIPVLITHFGSPFEAFKLGNKKQLKGRVIYGLGTNVNLSVGNNINNSLFSFNEPTFIFIETGNSYYRDYNLGLQASLGIQFHRVDGHRNLRVDVVYHKGLLKQIRYNVTYWNTSMPDIRHGVISGRGSWLGLRLSYPILLKSWQPKKL